MPGLEPGLPEAKVRVRFAPSPTGYPHLGNIRTALFNWLFARHSGGTFILRIEDTDVARTVQGATEAIMDGLRWLGLDWDEGPYFQSQRLDSYRKLADQLVKEDKAYLCYCSTQRLEGMRQEQMKRKQPSGYDRQCRNLTPKEKAEMEANCITPVVRFKSPSQGQTSFHDLLRGDIVFENSTLDDFILLKSDGYPTYHLANIADDHSMDITHVLRADEWLSSTPRHVLLYQALGWQPPQFVHLPMILGTDKAKLSKRHGAAAITEYRDQGYVPEALFNFLALLGWSLDDKTELLSKQEIVKHFSLERISTTAAVFNREKLDWMNGVYLRGLSLDDFSQRSLPFMEKSLPAGVKRPLDAYYLRRIMPLIQDRAKTLAEVPQLVDFFFVDKLEYDAGLLLGKIGEVETVKALRATINKLELIGEVDILTLDEEHKKELLFIKLGGWGEWCANSLEGILRPLAEELGLKTGAFFGLLRVAVTGRTASPPLFETMDVLGKERCLKRLRIAVDKLR